MFTRMILSVFLVFALAGCATGAKKQATQTSPASYEKYQQETYSQSYDYDDTLPSDTYQKPVKKIYSEPMIKLSAKQIQKALKNAGFYQGTIDGKIGPKTKAAILKFQKAKGLKVDGIVGKRTSAALNKYLSQ